MRHRKSGRSLGRKSSHRKAMYKNMAVSLIWHENIRTTLPKAKELRRVVEPLITLAKQDGVARRRLAFSRLRDKRSVGKLFDGVAWGGARVTRRVSDNAAGLRMRVAQLETGYDLDRPDDLRRVLDDLVRSANREPPGELRRMLARMVEVTRTRDGAEP